METVLAAQPGRDAIFELANRAKDAVAAGEAIRINAAEVTNVSPALIQLLLSIARSANEAGTGLTLVQPSGALIEDFQNFGLFAEMMSIVME